MNSKYNYDDIRSTSPDSDRHVLPLEIRLLRVIALLAPFLMIGLSVALLIYGGRYLEEEKSVLALFAGFLAAGAIDLWKSIYIYGREARVPRLSRRSSK